MTLEKTVICTCIQKYLFHEYSRVTSYMADQNGFLIKVTYIRYCKSYVKSLYIFCIIASSSDVMSSHHYLHGMCVTTGKPKLNQSSESSTDSWHKRRNRVLFFWYWNWLLILFIVI